MPDRSDLAEAFDRSNPARLGSRTLERIWADAYGSHNPGQIQPNAFYPVEVVRTIERLIGPGRGALLADLGCGHGGAGLHLARRLGTRLFGIDLSPASVALAAECATRMGLGDRAEFVVGDAADTVLETGSCAAVVSMDVLLFMPDKVAAIREVARILSPGGLFAFTTWEEDGFSDRLGVPQVADHRPLLAAAGFEVVLHEEPPDWRGQQTRVLESILAHEADLRPEIGEDAAESMARMAEGGLREMPRRRYVFSVSKLGRI